MFLMLTCFDLKSDIMIDGFKTAYKQFVEFMRGIDLVERSGPISRRQSDTIMDTDDERDHQYFAVMSFRDRTQVDAAIAELFGHTEPAEPMHKGVYSKVQNQIFICWEGL
jgi:hypothetical protein